ncbi:hypothetical protein CMV_029257 [Castanea mollissima]|uniref:Uncharacterized protein n=1 Tax=Castanea mollissima TaxID=60419 RepID=A0A8J4Q6U2_9ROSI|nr:hypothetical protein CMV_029257 [Castanea mollissima]
MSTNSSNSKEHSKVKRCLMKFLMSSRSHNSWRVIRRKIDCLQPGTVVDYKYYLHGLLVVSDEYLRVLYEEMRTRRQTSHEFHIHSCKTSS